MGTGKIAEEGIFLIPQEAPTTSEESLIETQIGVGEKSAPCDHQNRIPLFVIFLLSSHYYFRSPNVDSSSSTENRIFTSKGERDLVPTEQLEMLRTHVQYAAAIYCPKSELVNWTCGSRCVGNVIVEDFFHDEIKGASRDFINWVYNLRFALLDYKFPEVEGALVHGGFYETYDRVKNSILWTIQWMMARKENSCRGYDVIITGHSLGGALASFLAIDVKRYILDPIIDKKTTGTPFTIRLTTIGEPRVGNDVYAKIIQNQLILKSDHFVSRLTHRNDVIVHLPPSDRGFVHHPHEVWVKKHNETYICRDIVEGEPIEDPSCLAGVPFVDFGPHVFIWNTSFTPACV
ncbi:16230_t:CDS:2 [Acaulospora morrowiae]|uniref:16230_t:CDS:1 n=1 Tax=Acaulospora morrowiae TaxID=94023 RepID=A0A9N8ZDM0_9GLOM|nr:16230_t:CDS:2 [Acaulospora morrowiae]